MIPVQCVQVAIQTLAGDPVVERKLQELLPVQQPGRDTRDVRFGRFPVLGQAGRTGGAKRHQQR